MVISLPKIVNIDHIIVSNICRKDKDEYFYDRDPGIFSHVLNFYRTGQLHTPRDSCSVYIKQELDFWGISDTEISVSALQLSSLMPPENEVAAG